MPSTILFEELYAEPSRNGLTKPKRVRGAGTRMVNMGEIFAHGRIANLDMDKVPLSASERVSLLRAGDLLFARQSLVLAGAGKCSIFMGAGEDVCFESHIIRVRVDPAKANALYLYYFFQSPLGRAAIESIVEQGAGVAGIRGSDLARLRLSLLPRSQQDDVASFLCALDDKIDLNQQMNETLEAMAQAIFRDWFVDFGPVRRKLAGERDPVAIMGGLVADAKRAAKLAALFPDTMDGELPVGWSQGRASDLIEFNPVEPLKKGAVAPYSDMSSLPTKGSIAEAPVLREFGSGMRFRNGDALLARITPCLENGKTAFVDYLNDEQVGWGSTEFIVMRARAPVPKPLSYLLARHDDFRDHAIRSMTGTSGRQRAQADALEDWPMVLATPAVLKAFGDFVVPFFERIAATGAENQTLAETRDYVLPRLMSGKVRVADVTEAAT
jgi:type I restriction enzyme S subunit